MSRKETSLLLALGLILVLGGMNLAIAQTPSIFVDPASTIGELTPAPGSLFKMQVNVSDIPTPGLWAYQFFLKFDPEVFRSVDDAIVPLTNMNFTSGVSGWTTGTTGTPVGTPAYGYDATDGNPFPGSGSGSLYHKATATASQAANINFEASQQFTLGPSWPGTPLFVGFSYSYRLTGNAIGGTTTYSPSWAATPPTGNWTNPTYAYSSDNTYANSSKAWSPQQYGNYGISIASTWSPVKVEVGYEAYTAGDEKIGISVSWDNGGTWAAEHISDALGTSDPNTVTWADFTSATGWTSTKLSNANFRVRVRNIKMGVDESNVYLDWIPVRITISGSNMGIRVVTPSGPTRVLLTTTYTHVTPWTYITTETAGSIFSTPGTYTFKLVNTLKTNTTGTDKYAQFNWDDIGLIIAPISIDEGPFLKQGGVTDWMVKFIDEGTVYISNTLKGTPYSTAFPQTGKGMIANFTFIVQYGATSLDLDGTKLLTIGEPPTYPPIELAHSVADGYFSNMILGDVDYDGDVDTSDLSVMLAAYGSTAGPPASPNWNPKCDINRDSKVNASDLYIQGRNYGKP